MMCHLEANDVTQPVDQARVADVLQFARLYQVPWALTHAGDSQYGCDLIQHRKLWEVCDGVGGWVAD